MHSLHARKRNAPVADAADLIARIGDTLPMDFIADHCNTYAKPFKHADGQIRDGLIVVGYGKQHDVAPTLIDITWTAFAITRDLDGDTIVLGDLVGAGTFPAPAARDLSDDDLHNFAATILAKSQHVAIPTMAQAGQLVADGGMTRAYLAAYPDYLYDLYSDQLARVNCDHGYNLVSSCPSC